MGATNIHEQTIWEDGDATEMARVKFDGANLVQADLASITRKIFVVSTENTKTQIGDEVGDTITIATSVFDTLQTDGRWVPDVDKTGYNFRDRIPAAKFSSGDVTYRVEYRFVGSADEVFQIVYQHPTKEICGS